MNSAVRMLDRSAEKYKSKIFAIHGDESVTFSGLRETALALASGILLRSTPESHRAPVFVFLPKGIAALASFMGSMYAACPYVPVDTGMPLDRLGKIIDNLKPGLIITDEARVSDIAAISPSGCAVCSYNELTETAVDEDSVYAVLDTVVDSDPI